MQSVIPGLYASAPQALSFAPSIHVRAFLLQRREGNLLVYNVGTVVDDARAIEELGGVSRQYLNHWHEALFGSHEPVRELGAKLLVNRADAPAVERRGWRGVLGFSRRHALDEDFEAIPIPGHTAGATAYLWDNGSERLLFTGDSIYVEEGEWVAAVLDSSDRARYLESLELLRGLEFSVLVPWAVSADGPYAFGVTPAEARERIGVIIQRVASGQDR